MIPCIAIPFLNRPDLLQRAIDSIDFPVERLLIINNGKESLHELRVPGIVETWDEKVGQGNFGVASSWNYATNYSILVHRNPYVLIQGNDVTWAPGDLERMHQAVQDFPEADFVFGNHSYSNFILKRSGYQKVGWFDEEFWPAYFEDGDAWRKIILSEAKAIHAAGLHAKHEGSATIKSSRALADLNSRTYLANENYFCRKWGATPGKPGTETYKTPFNKGGDIRSWQLTPERMTLPYFRSSGGF